MRTQGADLRSRLEGLRHRRIEQDLNELGRQGWEAIDAINPNIGSAATTIVAVLKEPRA